METEHIIIAGVILLLISLFMLNREPARFRSGVEGFCGSCGASLVVNPFILPGGHACVDGTVPDVILPTDANARLEFQTVAFTPDHVELI